MKREFGSKIEELEFRQKRFFPLNIVAFILSVVAVVSLLVFPLLSINIGTIMGPMMGGDKSGNLHGEEYLHVEIMKDAVADADGNYNITFFTAIDFATGKADMSSVVGMMYKRNGMMEKSTLYRYISGSLGKMVDYNSLTNEQIEGLNFAPIAEEFYKAEGKLIDVAGSTEYTNKIVALAATVGGAPDSDDLTSIAFDFQEALTKGVTANGFSVEKFVSLESSKGEFTNYQQCAEDMMENMFKEGSGSSQENPLANAGNIIKIAGLALAGLTGLSLLMWIILMQISFIRIFVKNKTFKIWYVVLFGGLPFIILYGLVKLAGLVFADMLGEMASVLGAITSSTYIMGICWGVLILFSWFFLIPKRRKIKKLRKAIKRDALVQSKIGSQQY